MFLQHDRLKDVSPADLVRVAKTYLKPSNRTVGYYIPDAAPGSHGRARRAGSRQRRSAITRAPSSVVAARSFDPTTANIESASSALEARRTA